MDCKVTGCQKLAKNAGMCWGHYKRQRRHGDPLAGGLPNGASLEMRIADGLPADRPVDACWIWRKSISGSGYGLIVIPGGSTNRAAHRVVYEALVGPIAPGMQLDHLCRNRACVNPAHLEPVTQAENVRRGWPYRADYLGAN